EGRGIGHGNEPYPRRFRPHPVRGPAIAGRSRPSRARYRDRIGYVHHQTRRTGRAPAVQGSGARALGATIPSDVVPPAKRSVKAMTEVIDTLTEGQLVAAALSHDAFGTYTVRGPARKSAATGEWVIGGQLFT